MMNAALQLSGGAGTVVAPCACESFDLISTAAFFFQYAVRSIEAQQQNQIGVGIGAEIAAEAISATDFIFRVDGARSVPFQQGETIGYVTGGSAVIGIRPRRTF
jgi:hypothetical protein